MKREANAEAAGFRVPGFRTEMGMMALYIYAERMKDEC
jgi:hypothetical protein